METTAVLTEICDLSKDTLKKLEFQPQIVQNLQIDNEGVVNLGEQTFLQLNVINLLQVNNLCLFQRL